MHDIFENIRHEFILKATSVLAEMIVDVNEYNEKCGKQKLANIIKDRIMTREDKEK